MDRFARGTMRIALWVFLAAFACVFAYSLRHIIGGLWVGIAAVVLTCAMATATWLFGKIRLVHKERAFWVLYSIMMAVMLAGQLAVGWELRAYPGDIYIDLGILHESAIDVVAGEGFDLSYFSVFPHQLMPLWFYSGVYWLANAMLGYIPEFMGIFVNVVFTHVGLVFAGLAVKRAFGRKAALVMAALMLVFAPFYAYMPFFYFDTMAIPFMSVPIYIYTRARLSESKAKRVTAFAAMGAIFAMGILLRATVAIAFIGIVLHMLWDRRVKAEKLWRQGVAMIGATIVLLLGYAFLDNRLSPITPELREENAFPASHWVMMGLNSPTYDETEMEYTRAFSGKAAKQDANLKKISERLKERGIAGTVSYIAGKVVFQWGDASLRSEVYVSRAPVSEKDSIVKDLFTTDGKYFEEQDAVSTVLYFTVFFAAIFSVAYNLTRSKFSGIAFAHVVLMGAMLFFAFWEANPKYLVMFMPFMLASAADGILKLAKMLGGASN